MNQSSSKLQPLGIIIALGVAAVVAWILFKTAPKTEPEEKPRSKTSVQVIELEPTSERVLVTSWGTVIPAQEITVRPQVSGQILEIHKDLVPGGRLAKDDTLLKIDPADYQHNIIEREAELANAQFEYDLELGQQAIAKREWERLKSEIPDTDANPALALRKPHLQKAAAMITKANNAIERAQLDLKRTTIKSPFNCMVLSESVDIGQLVDSGNGIAKLVGTDAFWIQASVQLGDLKRIQVSKNPQADIRLDAGANPKPWKGKVIRLLSDLESNSRMARILIEVEDPLGIKNPANEQIPLLLGSYVRVNIEAGNLENVLKIPRSALREGKRIWLVKSDNRIRIAEPEILWTQEETIFISNVLQNGERLIVSDLRSALPEMVVSPSLLETSENPKTE